MTTPESSSTRPGRVAGVALLGIAAVALVIGLITAFGGDDGGRADGNGEQRPPTPPAATTTSRPSSTSESRPPSSTTSSVSPTTTTTTTGTGSGSTGQTPPVGDGNGEPAKSVKVRVYNNSTIRGLAAEAADDLRADGWQVAEVGNYPHGIIPKTTVYFRPGTDEEAAARAIGAAFGMRVEPRFEGIQDSPPGVIVIVTDNYTGEPAAGGKDEG